MPDLVLATAAIDRAAFVLTCIHGRVSHGEGGRAFDGAEFDRAVRACCGVAEPGEPAGDTTDATTATVQTLPQDQI